MAEGGEVKILNKWLTPANLPLMIMGLFVLCGTIISVFAGLPVVTPQQLIAHDRLYDERIQALSQTARANADQVSALTSSVASVTTAVAQLQQMQIDRREEETRNRQEYELKRQQFFYKHQDQHHRHEVDALTGLMKESRPQ